MRTLFTFAVFCIICDTLLAGPPITIRDNAGRIVSTITPTTSGVQVVRDSRGRVTATATVKSGTAVIRDSSGRIGSGSLLPSKSGLSGKGRGR